MKKHTFGRKLKRDTNERKALFKNLLTSLVLNEKVKTTEAKAKAIKAAADKLITRAKKSLPAGRQGAREAYRSLEAEVHSPAVTKLIDDLAVRFAKRQGGYTRIIKAGHRVADNAAMAVMEWTERASANQEPKTKNQKPKNIKSIKPAKKAKTPNLPNKPKQLKSPKKPVKPTAKKGKTSR